MEKEQGRISNKGMGCFLEPPTHYGHTNSITGKGFCMSIDSALECEWLDDAIKLVAQTIKESWKPLPLDNQEVKEWILQVMGYFHNCYQGADGEWDVSNLLIKYDRDTVEMQNIHAGVHLIRKYYPEFVLTESIVKNAYWGKKPELVS